MSKDDFTSSEELIRRRESMVEHQIKERGIKDQRVLDAMLRVRRHEYVPREYFNQAYEDYPLPIGYSQTISQPYIVAYMTEALDLQGDEKVLEIGTGSGYQAAVLGELARSVFTIEIIEPLCSHAAHLLQQQGYKNIQVRCGDGYLGWPEEAPFDAVMVTAAPTTVPQSLIDQLAEGGRMIIPIGKYSQSLLLLTKTNGRVTEKKLLPVRFVPMTGKSAQ